MDPSDQINERRPHRGHVAMAVLWFLACVGLYMALLHGNGAGAVLEIQAQTSLAIRDGDTLVRNLVLAVSAAAALLGFWAYRTDSTLTGPRASPWALLLGVTCTLLTALCLWNLLFIRSIVASGFIGDIFRLTFHNTRAPIYGKLQSATAWALAPLIVCAVLFAGGRLLSRVLLPKRSLIAWLTVAAHALLIVSFALSDGPRRLEPETLGARFPPKRLGVLEGSEVILSRHVERLTTSQNMLGRLSHYPPGHLLIQHSLRTLNIEWLHKPLMIALVALSGLAVAGICRELGADENTATVAHLLYATATTVLVFATLTFDILSAPLSTWCLWLLLRGIRTGAWWPPVMLGTIFAAFCLYTFAAALTAVLMTTVAIAALALGFARPAAFLKAGVLSIGVTIALLLALRYWSGFDLVACLGAAMRNEHAHMGSSFDSPLRYLLRSTGNILAFLAGSGIAISAVMLAALPALPALRPRGSDGMAGAFAWALAATIVIAAFSGAFHGETERVWLPLAPALAVAAAHGLVVLGRRETPESRSRLFFGVLLTALAASLIQELFFHHAGR